MIHERHVLPLANRKELWKAEQNERLLSAEWGGERKEQSPSSSLGVGRGLLGGLPCHAAQEFPDLLF